MLTSIYLDVVFEKKFAAKENPKMYKVKWDRRKLNNHLVQHRDHTCAIHVGPVNSPMSTLGIGCPEASMLARQHLGRVCSVVVARRENRLLGAPILTAAISSICE